MSEYTPPCEIYDEDFEFSAKIIEDDDETWEVGIETQMNTRCESCFLLEQCLANFYAIMENWFELQEEGLPKKACN